MVRNRRIDIPGEDEDWDEEDEEEDAEPKPVMPVEDVIKAFEKYLLEMHKAFDKVGHGTLVFFCFFLGGGS